MFPHSIILLSTCFSAFSWSFPPPFMTVWVIIVTWLSWLVPVLMNIALVLSIILWFLTSVFLFFTRVIDGNRKLSSNRRPLNHGHERKAVFGKANHFTIISAVFIMHTEHSMCIFYMHEIHGWPSISRVWNEPEIIPTAFITTFKTHYLIKQPKCIIFNTKKLD